MDNLEARERKDAKGTFLWRLVPQSDIADNDHLPRADDVIHKIEECVEIMEKGFMPPKSYKWMHSDADLSDAQVAEMIAFFKSLK